MRDKVLVTFLGGVVAGLVIAAAGWQPQAQAQRPDKAPQWEYKVDVVPFGNDAATNKLNQLAKDGWEYVGLVNISGETPRHGGSVAFRRPQR